jgi:hypothetical protein
LGVGVPLLVRPLVLGHPLVGGGGRRDPEAIPHAGAGGADVFGAGDDAEALREFRDEAEVGGGVAVGVAGVVVEALAIGHREIVGEQGREIRRVDMLRDVAELWSGNVLGVADGFFGIERLLVAVVVFEQISHTSYVAAEARPTALDVVDRAGGSEQARQLGGGEQAIGNEALGGGAEVHDWDREGAVAIFGVAVSKSDIGVVRARLVGIPTGDDSDRLSSVASALHSTERPEASCPDHSAPSLEGKEDFLMPGREALVKESVDKDERIRPLRGSGGDVALLGGWP